MKIPGQTTAVCIALNALFAAVLFVVPTPSPGESTWEASGANFSMGSIANLQQRGTGPGSFLELECGGLVTEFGSEGVMTEGSMGYIRDMVVDSGHIYLGGADQSPGNRQWRLEKRDKITGAREPSFGGGDGVVVNNPGPRKDEIYALALDEQAIYAVGFDESPGTDNFQWRIEKRDKGTGNLILGFGSNGVITQNPTPYDDKSIGIAVFDEHLYICGYQWRAPGPDYEWRVEKRNKGTGDYITAFSGGWFTSDPSSSMDIAGFIDVDASGLYIGGLVIDQGNMRWHVEKRNAGSGQPIASFGTNGKIDIDPSSQGDSLEGLVLDDTHLYLVGDDGSPGDENDFRWRIEKRSKATGEPDMNFDGDGVVLSDPSNGQDWPSSICVDTDYIYIAGEDEKMGNDQWRVEKRDKATGALVDAFGGGSGAVEANPSTDSDMAIAMVLEDGHLYVGGFDSSTGTPQFRIEKRYEGYAPLGMYTSTVYDTGDRANFSNLDWTGEASQNSGISFQVRTGATEYEVEGAYFTGSDGTPSTYYDTPGQMLHAEHRTNRYIQYKAFFYSNDSSASPTLEAVNLDYNLLPGWMGGPKVSFYEDSSYQVDLAGYSVDGDDASLVYSLLDGGAEGLGANIQGSVLHLDPEADLNGLENVTIRASDGPDHADLTIEVEIYPVNDAPVLTTLPELTLDEDGTRIDALDLWNYTDDVDDAQDSLVFSIKDSTAPECGVSLSRGHYVDIKPRANWSGEAEITFQVTDGDVPDTGVLAVTVTPINDVPWLLADPVVGTSFSEVRINCTLFDVESDPCVITAQYSTDGASYREATLIRWQESSRGVTGLESSLEGTDHFFVWDAATDLGEVNVSDLKLRLIPSDKDEGLPLTISQLHVDTRPVLTAPSFQKLASPDDDGDFTLTWFTVEGAVSYLLQSSSTAGFDGAREIYSGPDPSFHISGLGNCTYHFRVRAGDGEWRGRWSVPLSVVVKIPVILEKPVFQAMSVVDDDGKYQIEWDPVPGASEYLLQEDTSASFADPFEARLAQVQFYPIRGKTDGTYYYRIMAKSDGGASPWSDVLVVEVEIGKGTDGGQTSTWLDENMGALALATVLVVLAIVFFLLALFIALRKRKGGIRKEEVDDGRAREEHDMANMGGLQPDQAIPPGMKSIGDGAAPNGEGEGWPYQDRMEETHGSWETFAGNQFVEETVDYGVRQNQDRQWAEWETGAGAGTGGGQTGSTDDYGITDHYAILGVSRSATEKEIRAAYRKIAVQYHPDKVTGLGEKIRWTASEEMRKINEAKDTLTDPIRRAEYDWKLDDVADGYDV